MIIIKSEGGDENGRSKDAPFGTRGTSVPLAERRLSKYEL